MEIDRQFIQAEISQVEQEVVKARTFLIQAETSLAIYQMLLARLDQPDEEEIKAGGTD
jgi:hypothetical protein